MATIVTRSLLTGERLQCSWRDVVLPQIKQCERKSFPSNEAFNFEVELKKRNIDMVVILHNEDPVAKRPQLVAYLIFSHRKAGHAVLLHKICVVKEYRHQGIAKLTLRSEITRLRRQCSKIQLWVHRGNAAAITLYQSLGFETVNEVENYYGPGRTGMEMILNLVQT